MLLHGEQRTTKDIDMCVGVVGREPRAVAAALRELHAMLKVDSYVKVPIDATLLGRMEVATWRTASGDVDVLLGIPRSTQ